MLPVAPASALPTDALDDFHVSEELTFYARITAAMEFLLRGSSTPERVFRLYGLTEDDLRWFYRTHPDDTAQFKAAYKAAFPFTTYYRFCPLFGQPLAKS